MFSRFSISLKITLTYLGFGIVWIYASDTLTNALFQSIQDLQFVQLLKGWLFILISTLFLYFLSKKFISDLQAAKNEASEAKNLLENIINNAPVRIFWKDTNNVFLGANIHFLEDLEISCIVGKKDTDLNIREAQEYIDEDNFIMETHTKKLNYVATITNQHGKRKIVNMSKVPLLNAQHEVVGIIGGYQDITQQIAIENKIKNQDTLLLQQSKFTSMGEMMENIIHQWRQPLSIISTSATGLKLQKELGILSDETQLLALNSINDNVQYLAQTIDDFRNFFSHEKKPIEVELKAVLEKTLSLIKSRLKNQNITVITHYDNIFFETLQTELVHVFINIINNSIDAFKELNGEKYLFIETKKEDDCVIITLKDNAGGIPHDIISRVFEPYFTTKSGQGTGIGLYICKEIVVKHLNGKIDVKNSTYTYERKEYVGCEFTVELLVF